MQRKVQSLVFHSFPISSDKYQFSTSVWKSSLRNWGEKTALLSSSCIVITQLSVLYKQPTSQPAYKLSCLESLALSLRAHTHIQASVTCFWPDNRLQLVTCLSAMFFRCYPLICLEKTKGKDMKLSVVITWKWKMPAYPCWKPCPWGTTLWRRWSFRVSDAMAASNQQSPEETQRQFYYHYKSTESCHDKHESVFTLANNFNF